MSVLIRFRPVTKQWDYISCGSQLHDAMHHLFGFPCTLTEKNIPQLEAIYACGHGGAKELIAAINESGEIELKAEY